MHKRGVSQVDWVISLAIFLLYIAWFFIFIRPLAVQNENPNLLDNLREKIHENAYWTVLKYPIIISSNFSMQKEPIIVNTTFANQSNYFMVNKSFFFVGNKLFFLGNVQTGTSIVNIINSNETYETYNEITDLIANNNSASADGMSVELENSIVKRAFFDGQKIFSSSLSMNGYNLDNSNATFYRNSIGALYPITTQKANITNIILAYNPRIYTLFRGNASILQTFEIDKYDNYYFDSSDNGAINAGGCYEKHSDFLEFFTGSSVMLFAMSSPADISFCSGNYSVSLDISSEINGNLLQKIIFYSGDPADFEKYKTPYLARVGIPESITALSLFNLQLLNVTNYGNLKSRWNIGEFRVSVASITNGTNIIEFGGIPYERATVYAEETRDFLLDKYGELEDVRISIQSWT